MKPLAVIALAWTFTAISCTSCGDKKTPEETSGAQATDSVTTELVNLEKQFGDCEKSEDNCITITLEFPRIAGDSSPVADSVNRFVAAWLVGSYQQPAATPEQMMELYIQEYQALLKEEKGQSLGWQIEKIVSVLRNGNSILSLRLEEFENTGGASPASMTYLSNFDLHHGSQLTLADVLVSGYADSLTVLAEYYFRQSREIGFEEDLGKAGFNFKDNKFVLNTNFSLENTGITFVFNNMEIAPHSMGVTEFTIPYHDLVSKGLVKSGGALDYLLRTPVTS